MCHNNISREDNIFFTMFTGQNLLPGKILDIMQILAEKTNWKGLFLDTIVK